MIRIELDGFVLKIADQVFDNMLRFKQDTFDKPESGGILLGYYIENSSFTLTDVTIPTVLDKSSRFNFIRAKRSAQKAINIYFKESRGKKIYLGEWHSHPEDLPTPSKLDCKSIKEQIKFNKLNSNTIFMIIIGRKGLSISIVTIDKITFQKTIEYDKIKLS
jgi:integrative and conjugative element protein (TIGR02256 family)